MKDQEVLGKNAYLNGNSYGTVHDLYLSWKDGKIIGIIVARGLFKSKPVRRGLFDFDGKRYHISSEAEDSSWKPTKGKAIKHSRTKDKEVFAGPGWKIGRLTSFNIDTDEWFITRLDVEVEHQLIMRDVGEYRRLKEETGVYGFKHFYKDAYSFRPGKIVAEMGDSDKARFLADSGDSSIRGLGGASSMVTLPSTGIKIHESGTITLPIDAMEVQDIAIEMVNQGALRTEVGRRNILRNVFGEYYRRRARG